MSAGLFPACTMDTLANVVGTWMLWRKKNKLRGQTGSSSGHGWTGHGGRMVDHPKP